MSYSPAVRKKRRRRLLATLALVGSFLGIAYGVTRAQSDQELGRAYLDRAFAVATTASDVSERLTELVTDVESLNRATLLERLESMEADVEEMVALLDDAEPPGSMLEASLFLRIAATSWRSGISDARQGILALSSNPLDEQGVQSLTRGLTDLRVGDRAYSGFRGALGDVDTTLQGGPLPSVAFVPTADDSLFDPRDLARRMFVAGTITPVNDLAVADLKLEPGAVGESGGLPVLAVTADQKAEVTVTNRGNVPATGIVVRLSLLSNQGGLYQAEQEVPSLDPGTGVSLVYSDLPVVKGDTYQLTVSLPAGDDEEDNDLVTFRFLVNPDG
ncbi:MAG: hypothetical protein QY307_07475 [Acidimicrobiia bacterium]|nr:MAG: hypothetical protein QY307_07475 [Acidimicrobiia bacterium]